MGKEFRRRVRIRSEVRMSKYFEYTREENEYYALIKAESKEEADFVYWQDIAIDDKDRRLIQFFLKSYVAIELTQHDALEKFLSADEETTVADFYRPITNYVLLYDSDLIKEVI